LGHFFIKHMYMKKNPINALHLSETILRRPKFLIRQNHEKIPENRNWECYFVDEITFVNVAMPASYGMRMRYNRVCGVAFSYPYKENSPELTPLPRKCRRLTALVCTKFFNSLYDDT